MLARAGSCRVSSVECPDMELLAGKDEKEMTIYGMGLSSYFRPLVDHIPVVS